MEESLELKYREGAVQAVASSSGGDSAEQLVSATLVPNSSYRRAGRGGGGWPQRASLERPRTPRTNPAAICAIVCAQWE